MFVGLPPPSPLGPDPFPPDTRNSEVRHRDPGPPLPQWDPSVPSLFPGRVVGGVGWVWTSLVGYTGVLYAHRDGRLGVTRTDVDRVTLRRPVAVYARTRERLRGGSTIRIREGQGRYGVLVEEGHRGLKGTGTTDRERRIRGPRRGTAREGRRGAGPWTLDVTKLPPSTKELRASVGFTATVGAMCPLFTLDLVTTLVTALPPWTRRRGRPYGGVGRCGRGTGTRGRGGGWWGGVRLRVGDGAEVGGKVLGRRSVRSETKSGSRGVG